jgi:hypothetical protein
MSHYNASYFSILGSFSIISLFSILLNEINRSLQRFSTAIIFSIFLLSIVELFPLRDFPYIVSINYQEINIIRNVNGTILNVPIGYSKAMYLQTIHNRKIVDGYISRIPLNDLSKITSFFSKLNTSDCKNFIQILKNNEINYVITYNKGWTFQNDLRDLNYLPFFQTLECLNKENNKERISESVTLYSLS